MKLFITTLLLSIVIVSSAKKYKGAEIYSNQSYLYGKFEMRMKAAKGSGQLSTFFLYRNSSETSNTLWEEIDIEIFGKNTFDFQTNVIIEKVEGSKLSTEKHHVMDFDLSEDYHTFVVEWTPDSICWYVDSVLLRIEKVYALNCTHPMSIRFNHWAANISSWVGSFDTSVLPSYQYVDYLKYYSYDSTAVHADSVFTLEWTDDFSTFNTSRWSKASWTFGENLCDFLPANAYTENDALVLKLHDSSPPVVTSVANRDETEYVLFYPNPFLSSPTIHNTSGLPVTYSVFTVNGKYLFSSSIEKDVSDYFDELPSGSYILKCKVLNGANSSKVIFKQ